jgi:hypothetical protein
MTRSLAAIVVLSWVPCLSLAQDKRGELVTAEQSTSRLSGDSGLGVAVSRAVHTSGILLWPGAPVVVGADNIERFLGNLPDRDSLRLTWQPLGVHVSRDSSLGATWGVAVAVNRLTPGAPRIGRYISVRRREGGKWTIAALLLLGINPGPAGPELEGLRLAQVPIEPKGAAAPFVQADLDFARLAGDSGAAAAFRRWAARDAMSFGGAGLLVVGPEAISRAVAGPAVWRWHPVAAGAARSGDLGWTVGEAVITPKDGGPTYSKYLTVWSHSPGEPVRFLLDGGNSRPPAL